MAGSGHHGVTQITYTTEDVMLQLDSIQSTKKLIIHVGINDLKKESVEAVFDKYSDMTYKALEKAGSIVLSLVVPCKFPKLTDKINRFKDMVLSKFAKVAGVDICRNSNFSVNVQVK